MKLKMTLRSAKIFTTGGGRGLFATQPQLYAAVHGPSSRPQITAADVHGGAAPFWWAPMEFEVGAGDTLVARVRRRRAVVGPDKTVGTAELPAAALLDYYRRNSPGNNVPADIAVAITSKSGKPRGVLYVSYAFSGTEARPVPSAPPLCWAAPAAAVAPSAPYLPPDEIMLHSLL